MWKGRGSGPPYPAISATIQATQAVEGLLQYAIEVTISNGISTASKYFPFYVDASSAQNFCGATLAARGSTSVRIKGTWSRSAMGTLGLVTTAARPAATSTSGALPDLRISASDVSFTPSMPKLGDAVQVRFRVRNEGNGNAVGVPIALQINGSTVATETFDVAAGRTTLAGLQWNGVLPAGTKRRPVSSPPTVGPSRRGLDADASAKAARLNDVASDVEPIPAITAAVVIDPQHTISQKSTLEKSAPLAHFGLRTGGPAALSAAGTAGSQRVLLELAEGACVGVRMATGGAGPCGSTELEINVDDRGGLSLTTTTGIADLGGSFGPSSARLDPARLSSGRYVSQSAAIAGHSYAVQLAAGGNALLAVVSIRNPGELDARARALFRASAIRVLGKLGSDTGPLGPGDVAGTGTSRPTVFVELVVQTQ